MQEQNYKNHRKLDPLFHIVLLAIIIYLFVQSIINLVDTYSHGGSRQQAVMFLMIAIAFAISFAKIRTFPLKVQDRAIRAEENLRYYILTGKPLDKKLTISQIIALRFAPDHEMVGLVDRIVRENLSNDQIKKAIQHWRSDHHRA
ncbi:MAG TPA: DUF6526 family protein [Puia sp.]|jgi:hypothetical protein|nr:DUF6526 family protein [Puia sp.]